MKKGQVSMEYMIIMGFVTAIIVPLILVFNAHSNDITEEVISNQVNHIATRIVENVESIYYLGDSCQVTFSVNLPKNIENITISGREIVFYVKKHNGYDEVVKVAKIPMNGTLKSTPGIHDIIIVSMGDYVWLSN